MNHSRGEHDKSTLKTSIALIDKPSFQKFVEDLAKGNIEISRDSMRENCVIWIGLDQ